MSTRIWFAREAQFTADPKIQMLGHEFGPGGALVVEEVFALAKLAADNGRVTVLHAQIASRAFVTPAKARQILQRAAELGVIAFIGDPGPKGCEINLPRWSRWQVKDATAAARKAKEREAKAAECHAGGCDIERDIDRDSCVPVTPPTETGTLTNDREGERACASTPPPAEMFDDPRLVETLQILQQAPRLTFDLERMGVAHALTAYPHGDHVQAAHIAVSNVSDPNYRTTDAGRALRYAFAELERSGKRKPQQPTSPQLSPASAAREQRQNERERVALRLAEEAA